MKLKDVHTQDQQFEALWAILGKSKDGTKTLTVPRDALMAVMMDHANFYGALFPAARPLPKVRN